MLERSAPRCGPERPLDEVEARLGEPVAVPAAPPTALGAHRRGRRHRGDGSREAATTALRALPRGDHLRRRRASSGSSPATAGDGLVLRVPPAADHPDAVQARPGDEHDRASPRQPGRARGRRDRPLPRDVDPVTAARQPGRRGGGVRGRGRAGLAASRRSSSTPRADVRVLVAAGDEPAARETLAELAPDPGRERHAAAPPSSPPRARLPTWRSWTAATSSGRGWLDGLRAALALRLDDRHRERADDRHAARRRRRARCAARPTPPTRRGWPPRSPGAPHACAGSSAPAGCVADPARSARSSPARSTTRSPRAARATRCCTSPPTRSWPSELRPAPAAASRRRRSREFRAARIACPLAAGARR